MNKALSTIILCVCTSYALGQNSTILSGRIKAYPVSKVSILSEENPVTETRDEYIAQLSDSGKFFIEAKLGTTQFFNLIINDNIQFGLLLCPNTISTIEIDSNGVFLEGPTSDYLTWREYLSENYLQKYSISYIENQSTTADSIDLSIERIFKIKDQNISKLNEIKDKFSLTNQEYDYAKYRAYYLLYTSIYSELAGNFPLNNSIYQFLNKLPLDDSEAAKQSLDYNRALSVFIFYKVSVENKWYNSDSYDYSSDDFSKKYYEKILSEIKNEAVRNTMLTRKVCNSLFSGSTSAEYLYNRYKDDCTDKTLKNITLKYFNEYLTIKNNTVKQILIDTINSSLFDKLKEKKGKVLYLDFWASWCSPCIAGLPHTKKIQQKYINSPFEVIYVNVDDNMGSFETIAKKLHLSGTLIYLNKEESEKIRKFLKINGIPRYVLVDKNGIISDFEAPHPNSQTIINKIDLLLNQ